MTNIIQFSPSDDAPDGQSPADLVSNDDATPSSDTGLDGGSTTQVSESDDESILQFTPVDSGDPVDDVALTGADVSSRDDEDDEPDELEAAYRQALEMIDEAEWEIGQAFEELQNDQPVDETELEESPDSANSLEDAAAGLVDEFLTDQQAEEHRLSPTQIVEAVLFVGGQPVTAKKLAGLLRGKFNATFVERTIEELNARYAEEGRPYEIRLGEGGYELKLRYEFERVRHRVFGLGPKEVKLSQDALEVLSLVAYHQPMSVPEIEEAGKEKTKGTLRQLLRRELVALERGEKNRKKVKYVTTDRFLQVFGLGDIEELPLLGDLDFK